MSESLASDGPAARLTLVLVFKRPRPGYGKQRLAAEIGAEAACTLARHFLDCALEDLEHWAGPVVLAPASASDVAWAAQRLPRATVRVQAPGNLGERLVALDQDLRAAGHARLAFIGSDAPALGAGQIEGAAAALESHEVAIAPAADGGVVLMAARQSWPPLAGLPWSTAALGEALTARCAAAGLSIARLPGAADVDTAADLRVLAGDLRGDLRPARRALGRALETMGFGPGDVA
ncbi:MAG: DUF2064 domain-containing protein [Gammaproteobacteria bacterium]|nr:MAG: DUF2064 domain-containing protein [Gammaproteobacteria bacterium]